MRFEQLRVDGLRCLEGATVAPSPGLNLIVGPNGAGKTSLLEAAYLLSHGRSFRGGPRDALLRRGAARLQVYGEVRDGAGHLARLGLGREAGNWSLHVNGEVVEKLSDLVRFCAVVCFEPGTHALIAGPAEERRRFLDWGVFHVEHAFLDAWQRYRRALRQRNVLLRAAEAPTAALLEPWEREMDVSACRVDELRQAYLAMLDVPLREICVQLLPELGMLSTNYHRGWDSTLALSEVLAAQRTRDRVRGYTAAGIHRADWRLVFAHAPQREHLSRGQEKLAALACVLAQARVFSDQQGEWPVVCLDDLASELDASHQAAVVTQLRAAGAQVLVTGTHRIEALPVPETTMFHVEHGAITPA